VAAGIPLESITAQGEVMTTTPPVDAAVAVSPTEVPAQPSPAVTTSVQEAEVDPVVTLLQQQLAEARQGQVQAQVEAQLLKSQLEGALGAETALRPVATAAIHRLQVALGQAPMALEGLPAATLAQQFDQLNTQLNVRYPQGRVSQPGTDQTREPPPAQTLAEQRLTLVASQA
jgi:hypothetical protein